MKKLLGVTLVVAVLLLSNCSSLKRNVHYSDLAMEQEFSQLFQSHSFIKTFTEPEEAYDYVKTAQVKFMTTSGKSKAKGLAAKLNGPSVVEQQPVTVYCRIGAQGTNGYIDFSKDSRSLESIVRSSVSAELIFMVFFGDRGIALPSFYLKSGYVYTSHNDQVDVYYFGNNKYDAAYPPAWSAEKAFSYLRKEID